MKRFLAILVVFLTVVAAYAPAIRDGFVWDDTALILRDPLIRSWRLIPEGFNHYLFVDATPSDFYRPVQRLTYTVEYAFFAARPAAYHVTNIVVHALAAIALMLFAEALLEAFGCERRRAHWIALGAALIWSIHPVHTAAVVYISGRADPLAALFGFTGCYLVLRSVVRPKYGSGILLAGAAIAFLCSALSKETGLLFPFLTIGLLGLLRQGRAAARVGAVSLFVVAAYLSLRLPAEHDPVPNLGVATPISVRPITMARAVAEYAGLLVFPVNLHMDRDLRSPFTHNLTADSEASAARELQTLAGITLAALVVIVAVRAYRRTPPLFAVLICAAIAYLPVSGIIRLNASVAEHWIYVPSAFLLIGACLAGSTWLTAVRRSRSARTAAAVVLAGWTLCLGARTFVRTFDWKDQRTFLERTIAAGGGSARMLINLGALESGENHLDLASRYLTEALKKERDQPFGLIDLAAVRIKQSDFTSAAELLGKAIEIPVVAGKANELLAVLENKKSGRADMLRLRLAAHTGLPDWSIEKRYIKVLAEAGANAGAIQELQVCLQTQWYRAESWQLLAQLLARTGQTRASAEAMALANSYDVHLAARPAAL